MKSLISSSLLCYRLTRTVPAQQHLLKESPGPEQTFDSLPLKLKPKIVFTDFSMMCQLLGAEAQGSQELTGSGLPPLGQDGQKPKVFWHHTRWKTLELALD